MNKDINKRLAVLRDFLGKNITEMADELNYNTSNYNQIELGNRSINIKLLDRLIEVYNISADWLMKGDGNMFILNPKSKFKMNYNEYLNEYPNEYLNDNLSNLGEPNVQPNVQLIEKNGGDAYPNAHPNAHPNVHLNVHPNVHLNVHPSVHLNNLEEPLVQYKTSKNIYVPIKAQASYLHEYAKENQHTEQIYIPNVPYHARTFEVSGESMYPYFMHGDLVVCKQLEDVLDLKKNAIYIVVSEPQGIALRFVDIVANQVILRTTNEDLYKTSILPLAEIREIWEVKIRLTKHILPASAEYTEQFKALQNDIEKLKTRLYHIEKTASETK